MYKLPQSTWVLSGLAPQSIHSSFVHKRIYFQAQYRPIHHCHRVFPSAPVASLKRLRGEHSGNHTSLQASFTHSQSAPCLSVSVCPLPPPSSLPPPLIQFLISSSPPPNLVSLGRLTLSHRTVCSWICLNFNKSQQYSASVSLNSSLLGCHG